MPHPGEPTALRAKVINANNGQAIDLASGSIDSMSIIAQKPDGTKITISGGYPPASEVMFNGDVCAGDGTDGWVQGALSAAQHSAAGDWKYWVKYTLSGSDGPYYGPEHAFVSTVRQDDP